MASIFTTQSEIGETGILIQRMKPKIKAERKRKGLSIDGDGDVIIRWSTPIEGTHPQKYKEHRYNITKEEGIHYSNKNLPVVRELRTKYKNKVKQGLDPTIKTHLKNLTLTEALNIYLNERFSDKAHSRNLNAYNRIKDISVGSVSFGEKWVRNITLNDYQKVVEYRESQGVKYGTINRELTIVTSALNSSKIEQYSPPRIDKRKLKWRSKTKGKDALDMRITTPLKKFAQSIYAVIVAEKDIEYRLFHLLGFMTVRRVGEIQQLKVSDFDVKAKLIHTRAETTKTKRDETYPISDEILNSFEYHINKYKMRDNDKVFRNLQRPYSDKFSSLVNTLINKGEIIVNKKFNNSYTQHDNRSLIGAVMDKQYGEDYIGKYVLSHFDESNTNKMYTRPTIEGKREILNDYWAILRNVDIEDKSITRTLIMEDLREGNETYYESGELKTYFDGEILEGYYKNSSDYFKIKIKDGKPLSGIWYDEDGNEKNCTRATYKNIGL